MEVQDAIDESKDQKKEETLLETQVSINLEGNSTKVCPQKNHLLYNFSL